MRQTHLEYYQEGATRVTAPLAENRSSRELTTADILRIAECAESRVADFYRAAADRFPATPLRRLCVKLAEQNQRHARYWSQAYADLRAIDPLLASRELATCPVFQPESMVSLTWLGNIPHSRDILTGGEDRAQILRDAYRRIRALATFYEGLKGFTSHQAGIAMIERIVRMARRQCAGMQRRLQQLQEGRMPATVPCPAPVSVSLN